MMEQGQNAQPGDDAARQQMFETLRTLGDLYQQERRYLLEQTARAMGYQGNESGQFADYIQQIYDQTSMRGPGMRGGPPGGMSGPGAGAPPPGP